MRSDRRRVRFLIRGVLVICLGVLVLLGHPLGGQSAQPTAGLDRHVKAGLTCQGCHKEEPPSAAVPDAQCLACHGDLAKLMKKSTKELTNPHDAHHLGAGEKPKCSECHHIHKASEVSCTYCHQDLKFRMP